MLSVLCESQFPSPESVSFVKTVLDDSKIPYLYSSGNHDWHYEGLPGSSEALRAEWRAKSLTPLYNGRNPSHWSEDTPSGLRFIAIDNSTYQVDAEQLAFFKEHAAGDKPVVLLVHIPLCVDALQETLLARFDGDHAGRGVGLCGDPRWGTATDNGWETEQRPQW